MSEATATPYYQCQRCGNCCRWPGFVRLERGEEERIAAFLGLTPEQFVKDHCELHPNRQALSIVSRPNGECSMLNGHNVCSIQPVKPRQCAGFPNAWNFPGWRDVCEAVEVKDEGQRTERT